jgi:hypothetical protein
MQPAEEKRCPQCQGVLEEVKALACSSMLSGKGYRCHVCKMWYDRDRKPWAKVTSRGEVTMREREQPLVCLWHPGTRDIFSGYGLRMAPAHLVGVVMVDRPRPVDPAWLEEVRQTFGGYELVPMTRSGERGMICQMRIVEESRVHLRVMRSAQSEAIRQALLPLLADLPAVTLAMAWDESSGGWVSTMMRPPRFPLGQLVATPSALQALAEAGQDAMPFVARHQAGDWGELDEHDVRENEYALQHGFRLLSAYTLNTGVRLWLITEADRSATTILLPQEY